MLGTKHDAHVDDVTLDGVEAQLRSELLPIAAEDGRWLRASKKTKTRRWKALRIYPAWRDFWTPTSS